MAGIYDADKILPVEDIGDKIARLDPMKTPFLRLLKKGKKPTDMVAHWPGKVDTDEGFDGVLDGVDKTDGYEHTNREEIQGAAMKLRTNGWHVSDFKEVTDTHGVKDEVAEQIADDMAKLGRKMEMQLTSDAGARRQGGANKPYQSGGAFWWLDPAQPAATANDLWLQTPSNFRCSAGTRFSGTLAAFTEAEFEKMLRVAQEEMNAPVDFTGYVGSALKAHMSGWLQKLTVSGEVARTVYNATARDKTLMSVVDFFQFDAGQVRVFPAYAMLATQATGAKSDYSTRSGMFVKLDRWAIRYLLPPKSFIDRTKSGGPRGHHEEMHMLTCSIPKGQCSVVISADS